LVRAGFDGLNVGDIQKHPKIPASTLSHHIATLRHAELVIQRREGSGILVSAGYETMAKFDHLSDRRMLCRCRGMGGVMTTVASSKETQKPYQ
tara:strand:+ start:14 stop:292 length:279 start_codon:yes stop_codon:yes gene_type:complete